MTNGMIAWLAVDGDRRAYLFGHEPRWSEIASGWLCQVPKGKFVQWTGPIPEELRNCDRACMKVVLVIDTSRSDP